jgi:ketosteroid isomerase-like protein
MSQNHIIHQWISLSLLSLLAVGRPASAQVYPSAGHQPNQSANAMTNQPADVVTRFLTAVQRGDQAQLAALVAPNIHWSQPGRHRFAGLKKSSQEVFQMVGVMLEASAGTLRLTDVKPLTVNGNQVACLMHWQAVLPGGGTLDVDNIDVYTVEDGKLVAATIFSADLRQEDEFWGR